MEKLQLEDLAKKLGYSKTLISMVINGKGSKYGISKKTQELVLDALSKLNYTPNKFAKSLRTGKSFFIGLIVPDISNPFYSAIARNIELVLFENNYQLMVCSTDESEEKEKQLIDSMVNQQAVDGLLLATCLKDKTFFQQARFTNLPMVFIDRVITDFQTNYVTTDNAGGAKNIVLQLLKERFKRIACLAITPQYISTIRDRVEGYRDAMLQAGYKKRDELLRVVHFEHIQEDVERHLLEFKMMKDPPDAIFALNNHIAVVLLKALKSIEFASLSKLRIACFDDLDTFDILEKKVVSIAQPMDEIGKRSSGLIMDLVSGKASGSTTIVLPTRLVVR